MNQQEKDRIDRITEAVYYLLKGQIPDKILCSNAPDDEIRQLTGMINQLLEQFADIKKILVPLSRGELDADIPAGNLLASPFKQLQSSLRHLTWQTQQIARGDFKQHVDFMGDFSRAFNTMTSTLKESQEQLNHELEQFKQLAELKNNYLNIMAHDIRTPIGAIIGFADILLEQELTEQNSEYVETIKRSGSYLLNLINNILDMAKLEKQKMELESLPFSIQAMGADIGRLIKPQLAGDTTYIFSCDPDLPEMITGDPNRLRQVLINLLGNAAKFTQSGHIEFAVNKMPRQEHQDAIHFSVKDTGIGISPENIEKLFAPFSQADSSISSKYGGTGLGLSISKEIIELMGGTIQVQSVLGEGTEFSFDLPLHQAQKTAKSAHSTSFNKCHIFIVDDDQSTCDIISHKFNQMQVRCSSCTDSLEAYDIIIRKFTEQDPFSLVLLDIDMPKLNGVELAEKIKAYPGLAQLKIAAISLYTELLTKNISPGLFSLIASKPVSDEMVIKFAEEANYSFNRVDDKHLLAGRHILVVDDNAVNRFIVRKMLEKLDMQVEEAENGRQGIKKLCAHTFHFVLLDHLMPVMNGIEALEEIRSNPSFADLKIFIYSANDNREDIDIFFAKGAAG
ncbi:MAG: hypothetical protein DSY80_01160, partial [Desulfocapsa sp.]